jgi:hypothetical protein
MNAGARRVNTFQRGSARAILTLSLLLTASFSRSDERSAHHFDIAAQSLSSALNEFARQSQQQMLFAPDVVAQKFSSPIRGDMQPLAALKVLLKDSGLTFKTTPSGAILVGMPGEPQSALVNVPRSEAQNQSARSSAADLASITVEATRAKEILRHKITSYIWSITPPNGAPLGRWQRYAPLCPLVAGLPHDDGEYLLKRLSQIATAAGAPLAREHCKVNLYVVLTSQPDALMKAWSNRDPWMFDGRSDQGGTIIHSFLNAKTAARAWYNVFYTGYDGLPEAMMSNTAHAWGGIMHDLWSAIIVIDASRAKGVSYGQLAAYIAMIGLAQIRLDAKLDNAPTILQLFSDPEKAAPQGLSTWDQAFLKGLYSTTPADRTQRLAIARSMAHEIAP